MVVVFGVAAYLLRSEPDVRLACLIMLASATMRSYLLTARGVLQGLEQFGHDAIVTTLDRALLVAACGVALWQGAGIITVSLVFLGVRICTALAALALARRQITDRLFDRELWRRLPGEAIPIGLFLLVLNLYNRIDTVMLGSMVGDVETGLYGAAYPVYEGLTYATAIVSAVLVPRLSRLWTTAPALFGGLAIRSLWAVAALAIVVGLTAWPLTTVAVTGFFGQTFAPAALALRILILGLPAVYLTWVLHSVAIAAAHTRPLLVVTTAGTLLNVALNVVWIPRYAHNGAAAATVVSEYVVAGLLLFSLRRALRGAGRPGVAST
jgi:O-antigen/teichoic acid export membrane protein